MKRNTNASYEKVLQAADDHRAVEASNGRHMIQRRTVLASAALLLVSVLRPVVAQEAVTKTTYVVVHGAWGGGWDWRTVSDLLTSRGHRVFRPTLTGLGERAHLASPDIGLDTHILDIVNTIRYENLRDVTLVGHSYGGMVITGVADRIPDRIAHLAYVDAFVPENGESVMGLAAVRGATTPGQVQGGFMVPSWVKPGTVPPMDVPQPLKTFSEPITLKNPLRERIPTTFILTVDRGADTDAFDMFAARAKAKGWLVQRLTADHNAQRSAPNELCTLLEHVR
jgi:pimeloyl-ACP methyl ester carboxylesterase